MRGSWRCCGWRRGISCCGNCSAKASSHDVADCGPFGYSASACTAVRVTFSNSPNQARMFTRAGFCRFGVRILGMRKHVLTSKCPDSKTGVCAHCGPVKIRIKHGIWKCQVAVNEHRGESGRHDSVGGHGLTVSEAAELRHGKVCEICGSSNRLAVDHCHASEKIRGVLCIRCNVGLGYFDDDTQRMHVAIEYLKKHSPVG
ncbi:endonuclease domain-containing protein [Variovorax sp. PAMC 28711]|uniref:endonuclease domain-containing protein n=1 Tax=Variovorax sp. PAMC 28711 TaxID=1795631 RepID=UPI0009E7CBB8